MAGSNNVTTPPTITAATAAKIQANMPNSSDADGNLSTIDTTQSGAQTYAIDPGTGLVRQNTFNGDGSITGKLITPQPDPPSVTAQQATQSSTVSPPADPTQTSTITPSSNIVQPPPAATTPTGNTAAYNANANSQIATNAATTNANITSDPTSGTGSLTVTSDGQDASSKNIGTSNVSTTPLPPSPSDNNTDVIYQDIKCYIEGVQVPFEAISVTQSIGKLPTAVIQIPPAAGLMDIARYYQPKIHIFYTDNQTGGDRLLFWGHIASVGYSASQQGAQKSIQFNCVHKNALLEQVTMEWSGGGSSYGAQGINLTDTNPEQSAFQFANFNSELTMTVALAGVTGVQSDSKDLIDPSNANVKDADATKIPQKYSVFQNRFAGMPSVAINLWNQAKKEIFTAPKLNMAFSKMFLPLIEDGLGFFERLSGHYFLENQIQNSKKVCCTDNPKPEMNAPLMLPPSYRMDVFSAYQGQLAVQNIVNQITFSNEMTNFYELFYNFLYAVGYDMTTLASPAEVQVDPTITVNLDDAKAWRSTNRMAIETIMLPQVPFYYAPICNVLLPNMYHTIQIVQDENTVPTRITAVSTAASSMNNNPGQLGINFRGPQSIRESIAIGSGLSSSTSQRTLKDTLGPSYNIPGKYELGHGIKHKKIQFPFWLSSFCASANSQSNGANTETFPIQGTLEYKNLQALQLAWTDRYRYNQQAGPDGKVTADRSKYRDILNPYTVQSGLQNHERLLVAAADYDFAKEVVKARSGSVECLFNPYIIPGYPMDIIDKSPENPSFHALCASVTHNITSRSISTSVSFMAASTYTELSNYFIQPTSPWLQTALKLVNVAQGTTSASNTGTPIDQQAGNTPLPDPLTSSTNNPGTIDSKLVNTAVTAATSTAGVQIQSSQFSTNYGLTANPSYDSNTGDVSDVQQTIVNNPRAKAVADQFYQQVLGVGAAAPEDVYDFTNGVVKAVSRNKGLWSSPNNQSTSAGTPSSANGGLTNDNLTAVGNLRLVSRQVECKESIQDKFKIKFIDLTPTNYTGQPAVYQNQILTNSQLLEPGQSMFLDYQEIADWLGNDLPNADSGIIVDKN